MPPPTDRGNDRCLLGVVAVGARLRRGQPRTLAEQTSVSANDLSACGDDYDQDGLAAYPRKGGRSSDHCGDENVRVKGDYQQVNTANVRN